MCICTKMESISERKGKEMAYGCRRKWQTNRVLQVFLGLMLHRVKHELKCQGQGSSVSACIPSGYRKMMTEHMNF
jgi:hypothetical protein